MQKKKLLIFHPALAPYRVDQFNALNQRYELHVVFLFENIWDYQMDQSKLLSLVNFNITYLLKGPRSKGRVFRYGMLKTIRKIKPDLIVGYEYSFTTQYLILLKRLRIISQKIGSTIDDSIDICNHIQSKIRFVAREYSVKHLDFLIVMSSEVSLFYQKNFNLKEDQIIISPILQDPDKLRSNQNELENIAQSYIQKYNLKRKKVLLFVGRFVPEKALSQFLNNIQSLLQEQEHLVLVLVGSGRDKETLQAIVAENDLGEKVLFPGKYEGLELYAWYLCASCFVLPSIFEPFGAVVNEALIFGLKVFCTQYAGASCLINPNNGQIFNPSDKEDTTGKLKSFLDSTDIIDEINLSKKPSLMGSYLQEFFKEWEKLSND